MDKQSTFQDPKEKHRIQRDVKLSRPRKRFSFLDYVVVIFLTVVAFCVRAQRLMNPAKVVFEELRYYNYAVDYVNNKLLMDVYPPLGKLLFSLVAALTGNKYELNTLDEPGQQYPFTDVAYSMRLFTCLLGSLLVPLMYGTVYFPTKSKTAASLAALFVIFDNGLITMSRYIMIEIPALYFMSLTAFYWSVYEAQQKRPFSLRWHTSLLSTGVALGLALSTKLSAMFTFGWLLILAAFHLWNLLGDLSVPMYRIVKHLFSYIFYLIGVPITVYLAVFAVHSHIAYKASVADAFLPPEHRHALAGNRFDDQFADVAYGSLVTIRNAIPEHGYLHSSELLYPEGTEQQIISLVDEPNQNALWIIEHEHSQDNNRSNIELLKDGSVVRLRHVMTGRALHSHEHKPIVSNNDWQLEASAYGGFGFEGDANDLFRIQILEKKSKHATSNGTVETLNTKFRLIHVFANCELMSSHRRFPDWGDYQREVTCCRNCVERSTTWFIESNYHDGLPSDSRKITYRKPGFLESFVEHNKLMWLKDRKMGDGHVYESSALTWPLLLGPLRFFYEQHLQVFFMGNPFVWYSVISLVAFFVIVQIFCLARWNLGYNDFGPSAFHYNYNIGKFVVAWLLHWAPYILETDRVFLYHYLPALYFGIAALGVSWSFLGNAVFGNRTAYKALSVIIMALMFLVYRLYSPFTYMTTLTKSSCRALELKGSWNFHCNTYLDNLSDYKFSSDAGETYFEKAAPHPFVYSEDTAKKSEGDTPLNKNLNDYYPSWDQRVEAGYKLAAQQKAEQEAREAAEKAASEAAERSSSEAAASSSSESVAAASVEAERLAMEADEFNGASETVDGASVEAERSAMEAAALNNAAESTEVVGSSPESVASEQEENVAESAQARVE
ncbi:Dolichyl-phosphate-mannose--protein mannosyltransferase [Schizosaccharomyces pombe]|uniref:Dolichyl-phosphate-mannose--protein mannosyltransferase 1 n=1 Tax=Schizosaccharomyces pombe (strain 972 / ATCC 24843) TaxID=284812 RepID=PMT1_SCHPO|nr:protein O-mannosyltransferase Ogm1 [Schizosaccharomyces pombe]O13898.1 RecName: Full=Dolichyl-phosphate-mannose--protein mannosyltransferase 1 [Schizosaccharomyces pombe 972h-]CAB16577.1 protein O-mannosyltransferase Ogm1 [Schizosaccharomyces pombe]|eukprot:NP_593237.1 protein O-mannosyltransferase Ogm1 [Schizosaccharomyces pombe]